MMSQPETSYFTLRPCDKQIGTTDPKSDSQKHTLSTADTNYLHALDLPSLPPLSHLLTTDGDNNESTTSVPASHQPTTNSAESSPISTASSTTSVAQALVDQEQKEQQLFNSTTATTSPVNSSTLSMSSSAVAAISAMTDSMGIMAPTSMHQTPVTTAPLTMLMDPTSAAAAAAAASLMASNPLLPPSSATGHPSSFYNMSTSSSPTNTTNTDLASSLMMPPPNHTNINPQDAIEKNYSFVSIPGANQRKRPRRRYDEIERLYHCTWPGCTKSYGTLNHLNAHVSMQKHGEKRQPAEFKEMRRNWRRQKKEREVAKKAAEEEGLNSTTLANTTMTTAPAVGPIMPSLQTYNTFAPFPMYTSLPQNMASIGAFY